MQYIHVSKDKPQDPREQAVELAGINIPVPPTPDFRVKQETEASSGSDAPALRPKRERIIGLSGAGADAIKAALARCNE